MSPLVSRIGRIARVTSAVRHLAGTLFSFALLTTFVSLLAVLTPGLLSAQSAGTRAATPAPATRRQVVTSAATDSTAHARGDHHPPHYWRSVAAGFATSILAHEAAHVATSLALGARPTFRLNKGRPTVYSGIDVDVDPRKQFLFSSMGLNVQAVLDEAVLDVPHARGAPFERGVLAGGIATALFYVTIGRTASVSDIDYMARTSSLNKTDLTLIYGGVALMHLVRIQRDGRYANFFLRPMAPSDGGLQIGVHVE